MSGKLLDMLEQGIAVGNIQQQLVFDGWNYQRYPNPEIILLTKQEEGKIILLH